MAGNNYFSVAAGVGVGVLGALFVLVLSELVMLAGQYWKRWRYPGARIAGEWKGLGTGLAPVAGEWNEITLVLVQQAAQVRGRLALQHRSPTRTFSFELPVAGRIAEGHLALGLPGDGAVPASLATGLLKIEEDGLVGQLLYRDAALDRVEAIDMSVHRAVSAAVPRLRPLLHATA